MAPAVRAPGHVSLKGIMVRLKLKKGFEEAEIPVDVQQTTALQTRCSISAAPRRAFAVGVELGPEIDSQPDSRAFMVSIAYDARNDASHRTQMRTDSWLLPDVTRSRLFMSHHAIVYDPQHRRTFSYQRNMPGYTATPHLPPTSERHSRRLCDMKAHEGGISIYVHSVKRKAPVADRKRIPADEVEELEGKQTLVAEFHFLNTDAENDVAANPAPLPNSTAQKTAKAKHAYFEFDDEDGEEPLPTRPDSEIKQETRLREFNQTRRASVPGTGATTVAQTDAPASEKTKKRARLNLELEAMEIEEQQLEVKKSKVMLKRQLLQLDEED